jgi:hypothetical protein
MAKSLVVTGANSYLARMFIGYVTKKPKWHVCAVASHRGASPPEPWGPRIKFIRADLTQALPESIVEAASQADAIVQFAWTRDRRLDQACDLNRRMTDPLLACASDPSIFRFISTVAATPTTRSVYGRSKFELARYITERGGVAVACGLVKGDPPAGPYALLSRCIKLLPLRIRFAGGGPLVYPIEIEQMCSRLAGSLDVKIVEGTYKLCEPPMPMNGFLEKIELLYPRLRVPMRIHVGTLMAMASLMSRLGTSAALLSDKVLTFFQKDDAYLASLPDLPRGSDCDVLAERGP